jgi:hypothetical protein
VFTSTVLSSAAFPGVPIIPAEASLFEGRLPDAAGVDRWIVFGVWDIAPRMAEFEITSRQMNSSLLVVSVRNFIIFKSHVSLQ